MAGFSDEELKEGIEFVDQIRNGEIRRRIPLLDVALIEERSDEELLESFKALVNSGFVNISFTKS